MRATLRDVVRHPSWLPDWWIEVPYRRRSWWRVALLAPGEGWLRWAPFDVEVLAEYIDYYPRYEPHVVFPPLRRLAMTLRWALITPRLLFREHLSWEESAPDWSLLRADPERRRELWGS